MPLSAKCAFGVPASPTRAVLALLVCLIATLSPGQAQTPAAPATGIELLERLRQGGYNLYFRHAATDWSQDDLIVEAGDWKSCDPRRVRQLSDAGRAAARTVGEAIRKLGVPVGEVFASPYCRTIQTAEAMALGEVRPTTDVMNLRVAEYFGGREAIIATARQRLASQPATGGNNIYVAHGNLAVQATGVYPGEGEAVIFRPLGGERFEYVGRLDPAQWQALADGQGSPW